jgi:hypothetical protein
MTRKLVGHWRARANDYWDLAKTARDAAVLQVLEHLARVCEDMANALEPRSGEERKPPEWIYSSNIPREATAQRWRTREAAYLAQADHCQSAEGIQGWRTLAGRCAELAAYLEATQPQSDRRRSG